MKENNNRVTETLAKIEHSVSANPVPVKRVASTVAAATGTATVGPVPSKVFDEVMQELAQLRKVNPTLTEVDSIAEPDLFLKSLNSTGTLT